MYFESLQERAQAGGHEGATRSAVLLVFGHAGIFRALLCRDFRNCEVAMYHWPPAGFPPGSPARSWDGSAALASSKL